MQVTANIIYLALLFALARLTQAVNNQPCISGECTWSGGDNVKSLYSSLSINGSHELIGDVTPAAGWNMQGCDPNWSSGTHSVQMVCAGDANQTQHCPHIFRGGAEDTIVRLPDDCGTGPFARVIKMTKMNGSNGTWSMDMDYHLSRISSSKGSVNFSLTLGDGFHTGGSAPLQKRDHSFNLTSQPIPFTLQKSGTLLSKSLSCSLGQSSASLGIEVDASSDITGFIDFSGVVSGKIVPPKVTEFKLITTLTGSGSINFDLDASIQGSTGSGNVDFLDIGIPGLDIPGVVTIGPSIEVDGKVDVNFDLQTKASVNAQLNLTLVQLILPPSEGQSIGYASSSGSNPVQFSFNPGSTSLDGTVTGHIIPKFKFGISVLEDIASADVFLQADLSADLDATLQRQNKRDYHPHGFFMKRQNNQACLSSNAGIDISAGVSGSIGPLSDNDNIPIFSNSFQLFQQCFDIGSDFQRREIEVEKRQDDSLQCPTPSEIADSLQSLL